jgi:hypothetical protein
MKSLRIILILVFVISQNSANSQNKTVSAPSPESTASEYAWGMMLGYGLHAGVTDQSLASIPVYFGKVNYSRDQGFLRPGAHFAIQTIKGNLSFLQSQTDFNMVTIGGGAELLVFFLENGSLAPFVGAEAYLQRGSLLLSNAPSGYAAFNRPNIWGYELAAGFDLQKNNRTRFRFRMSFSTDTLKVTGLSPVNSTSFRVSVGF